MDLKSGDSEFKARQLELNPPFRFFLTLLCSIISKQFYQKDFRIQTFIHGSHALASFL